MDNHLYVSDKIVDFFDFHIALKNRDRFESHLQQKKSGSREI